MTSTINTVALAGGSGALGLPILQHLLDAGFKVTVLSREGSSSADSLPSHANQKIVKVNYNDTSSIAAALQGIDAVVSALASPAIGDQAKLLEAAASSGVRRFIPSEFGSSLNRSETKGLPVYAPKLKVRSELEKLAAGSSTFSYTLVTNGPFLDWGINHNFLLNVKDHSATLWDGGNVQFSTTTLATVAKAVTAILKRPDETKNREIVIHDTAISLNEMIAIVKDIDSKEWTVKEASSAEALKSGLEELKGGNPTPMAFIKQLVRAIFSKEAQPKFEKVDNEWLGLPQMSKDQVRDVIKSTL